MDVVLLIVFYLFAIYLAFDLGVTYQKHIFNELRKAVTNLYFAAYWGPDRYVPNENKLWQNVRDAAKIQPNQTFSVLGPSRWEHQNKTKVLLNE